MIKQARQSRRPTLRRLADRASTEDGRPISPQYLFDIEIHRRVPSPHVLQELARVLELDYDTLPIVAGAADVVVREYLATHPEHTEAVIRLVRAALPLGFADWNHRGQCIDHGRRGGS
jgi:transcriptional regulator with XRE-family HTH domain